MKISNKLRIKLNQKIRIDYLQNFGYPFSTHIIYTHIDNVWQIWRYIIWNLIYLSVDWQVISGLLKIRKLGRKEKRKFDPKKIEKKSYWHKAGQEFIIRAYLFGSNRPTIRPLKLRANDCMVISTGSRSSGFQLSNFVWFL